MNDAQFDRYSRQMILPQVGRAGQQRLLDARVLIVGAGGLGSPVALYLAAAGVGTLALADFDLVELSNLQRQIAHRTADIGRPKVESAADTVRALNPDVTVVALNQYLDDAELAREVGKADLVVDASDNFDTRFRVNEACVAVGKPLVSGAAIRMEGQVSVFRNDRPDAPCYRCLYREQAEELRESCDANGVLAPVVGIIGSIQALEALKVLLGIGQDLSGRLLVLDAAAMEWRSLRLRKDPGCPVCATRQEERHVV